MPTHSNIEEAEASLSALAEAFFATAAAWVRPEILPADDNLRNGDNHDFETRYEALVESIPAVVFIAPLQAGLGKAYVSPQIEKILGFTQEEWLHDPLRWYERVHPEDKHRWSIEAATLFSSGRPLSSSYRVLARDGRVVWFQCDARMVRAENGKPSFIQGIGFDVSELKETEASLQKARAQLEKRVEERTHALAQVNAQLREEIAQHKETARELISARESVEAASRTKAQFLANMSHEMRTPMNGVIGLTNLVLDTELTAEQRHLLTVANKSAEALLRLINQLLNFSESETGELKLSATNFSLRASLAFLIDEWKEPAKIKGLDLSYRVAADVPDTLAGDLKRLLEVLTNLLDNAVKFTAAGSVSLSATLDAPAPGEPAVICVVRFSIRDTGIGIPPSKAALIFEPFTQADGSFTRHYGGTGLGLAYSKRLVEMMGGELTFESEPGHGSTFSFNSRLGIAERSAGKNTLLL